MVTPDPRGLALLDLAARAHGLEPPEDTFAEPPARLYSPANFSPPGDRSAMDRDAIYPPLDVPREPDLDAAGEAIRAATERGGC